MNREKESCLQALEEGKILTRDQWKTLVSDPCEEDAKLLAQKPGSGTSVMAKMFSSGG